MIYVYPKPQKIKYDDALFIMASTFDSGEYSTYRIHSYTADENNITTYDFSHNDILEHLTIAPADRAESSNFAQGEPFIRLRLHLGKKYENI